jgi:hypothetical protein
MAWTCLIRPISDKASFAGGPCLIDATQVRQDHSELCEHHNLRAVDASTAPERFDTSLFVRFSTNVSDSITTFRH